MAESSSEPSAAPAIPTNKPWLLKPKYPGPSAFFYAYLPEDEYYMVGGTDNDPSVRSECEYYGGRQALLNIVEQTFLEVWISSSQNFVLHFQCSIQGSTKA
ncbi:hypothetical protein L3Y34_006620 [Caenorhabditis briggsae]|uniref:Uncharacterized protein n=1 Tax=Caenorhabditis briggsae TaxID=6238 RepID=A0AAE8ZUR2_CAEBR|nr:hypothetical protein L3Y34_006620 [Caenorhabditis briggsae]